MNPLMINGLVNRKLGLFHPTFGANNHFIFFAIIGAHLEKKHLQIDEHVSSKPMFTPRKINMEPENHLFEKENHLPNPHFWVPC